MKLENAYLSEEELERLILQVEERELVIAPPDLEEKILLCSDFMQEDADGKFALQKERLLIVRDKKAEFRRYCFQVITSAVAAIAIVFGLSYMEMGTKAERISRQEVLKASITREDVLNDTKIFSKIFNEGNDVKIPESRIDKE